MSSLGLEARGSSWRHSTGRRRDGFWVNPPFDVLREEISPHRLRNELKRNDLMNDALSVNSWMKVE
jgi:hypothetical protein